MKNYKTKICLRCGKEYIFNSNRQKYCFECGIIVKREQHIEYAKQWEKDHAKQRKEQNKQWTKDHLESKKEYNKEWNKDHVKQKKEYHKQWKKDNPYHNRQYYATPRGKEIIKRAIAKRTRNLGYITLNEPFEGSVGHHINYKDVIYIPEELHKSVRHCLETRQGMIEINTLAIQYLIDSEG